MVKQVIISRKNYFLIPFSIGQGGGGGTMRKSNSEIFSQYLEKSSLRLSSPNTTSHEGHEKIS